MGPRFLEAPQFAAWLEGMGPVWTSLDRMSLERLYRPPSEPNAAIRLARDLPASDLESSAVAMNAMVLLRRCAAEGGMPLTATGNLSRAAVREMCDAISWPDFDKAEMLRYYKVINEPDLWPLHFLRLVSAEARLLRKRRGRLHTTRLATDLIAKPAAGNLQALLFETAFWRINLGYFDRAVLEYWPQSHIGVVLWSLSVAAGAWEAPERLARLCTVPIHGLLDRGPRLAVSVFETRVLRPLSWFGLIEARPEPTENPYVVRQRYRKSPAFDRFLSFDAVTE